MKVFVCSDLFKIDVGVIASSIFYTPHINSEDKVILIWRNFYFPADVIEIKHRSGSWNKTLSILLLHTNKTIEQLLK